MQPVTTADLPEVPAYTVGATRTSAPTPEELQTRSEAANAEMLQAEARRMRAGTNYRCGDCSEWVPAGMVTHCTNGRTWMRDGEMVCGCHKSWANPEGSTNGGAAYVRHLELAGNGYCDSIDLSEFAEVEGVYFLAGQEPKPTRTRKQN
jgi:hypothetical protein